MHSNMMDGRLLFGARLIYLSLAKEVQKHISWTHISTLLEASVYIWLLFMAVMWHPAAKLLHTSPTLQKKIDDWLFIDE